MIKRLDLEDLLAQNRISDYELGTREPSLIILLQYARAANVIADVLIDDELDLPARLPSPTRHDGIRRKPAPRAARRNARPSKP
jgi:transcriptional regulator with XRE-family HTH domain